MDNKNISYKEPISELNEINERVQKIKEKIEKEISKIEDSQLVIFNELVSSFKKRRLELEREEKLG